MSLYRKKPVVIEAFQMTRERRQDNIEWPEWLNMAWNKAHDEPGAVFPKDYPNSDATDELLIFTLEGVHLVQFGDWIIKGVAGELYPCKPEIFEATYVEAQPSTGMTFGQALEALKADKRVAREGWNGKGMFVSLVSGHGQSVEFNSEPAWFNPYMVIKNVNGSVSTWVPSVNDVLSEDWGIVA